MIKIDNFDVIFGGYKGVNVIGGKIDEAIIYHLKDWYEKSIEFVEYDGNAVQVAFLNFIKHYLDPQMDWKTKSNTFKNLENPKNIKYPRRNRKVGKRPTSVYNKK